MTPQQERTGVALLSLATWGQCSSTDGDRCCYKMSRQVALTGLRMSEGALKSSWSQPQKQLRFPGIDMAAKYYETVYNYVCTDQKSLELLCVCLKGMFLALIHNAVMGFRRHHHATPAVQYMTALPLVEIYI